MTAEQNIEETMAYIASQKCERLHRIEGCLGPAGYSGEERCIPCIARAALGMTKQPERCAKCHVPITHISKHGGDRDSQSWIDEKSSLTCAAVAHVPTFAKKR